MTINPGYEPEQTNLIEDDFGDLPGPIDKSFDGTSSSVELPEAPGSSKLHNYEVQEKTTSCYQFIQERGYTVDKKAPLRNKEKKIIFLKQERFFFYFLSNIKK